MRHLRLKPDPGTTKPSVRETGIGSRSSPGIPSRWSRNLPLPALGANMAETRENSIHLNLPMSLTREGAGVRLYCRYARDQNSLGATPPPGRIDPRALRRAL